MGKERQCGAGEGQRHVEAREFRKAWLKWGLEFREQC